MNPYSNTAIFICLAHLIRVNGILNIARSNQQMTASNILGPLYNMGPIIRMIIFPMVLSSELVVGEVGGDVVELVFVGLLLHGDGVFGISYEGSNKLV